MTDEQADEMLSLLRAIAEALVPNPKVKRVYTEAELKGWREVNRELGAIRAQPQGPDASGLPPAGGDVDPRTFWERRDDERHGR